MSTKGKLADFVATGFGDVALATDESNLYALVSYAHAPASALLRIAKSGGPVERLLCISGNVVSLAVDGDAFYFATENLSLERMEIWRRAKILAPDASDCPEPRGA
jgi:hypothetical protein